MTKGDKNIRAMTKADKNVCGSQDQASHRQQTRKTQDS